MAIQFLNDININQNEVQKLVFENQANDAGAGTGIAGQIFFDTTVAKLKVWTTSWQEIGGGVETLTIDNTLSTYVDLTNSGTATNPILDADLNATGTASGTTFLRGDNVWSTPVGLYLGWKLNVTGGTEATVDSNDSVIFAHGTFLEATIGTVGTVSTVTHSLSATGTRDATTYLSGDNSFKLISSIPGLYTKWTAAASNGSNRDVETTDVVDFIATDGMSSTISANGADNSNITFANTDKGSAQNIFKNVAVAGQNTIVADNNNDTLNVAAGANITITTNDSTDTLTITGQQGYSGWTLGADSGTDNEIVDNDDVDIAGGTAISTSISTVGAKSTVTITHEDIARSNSTSAQTLTSGGTFIAIDTLSANAQGHVTGTNAKTFTMPTLTVGTVTEVDAGTGLVTNPTGGIVSTGTVSIDYDGTNNFILAPATAVAIAADQILFNGTDQSNVVKKSTFATIPITAVTAIKTYIDNATTGALVFQGGYNAATNTPELDSRGTGPITVEKGWTYAITDAGTFYGEVVEAGDLIIANVDSADALTEWTIVQANIGIAGAGSSDGGTDKGISGYFNGDFAITANGFVTLLKPPSSTTKNIVLNSSVDGVSVSSGGGYTTYVIDLSAAWAAGIESENVMCEVRGTSSAGTGLAYHQVFTNVVANADDLLSIEFKGSVTEGHYRALLVNVE